MKLRQRRISRMEDVGRTQLLIAGAMAGLFGVLTLYILLHVLIGLAKVPWAYLGLAALAGLGVGLFFGARSAAAGASAGILAGIWIFAELIGAAIAIFLEIFVGLIAGIFAIFN